MCATVSEDVELIERGCKLFARPCRFVAGVARLDQLPGDSTPEIAFAGRSNVGKSSLLNALTGQRKLAMTSVTPGRTRQLNFFSLDDRLMLTDLPGYGYAKAPKGQVAAWTDLIDAYLRGRVPLRRVLVLIDSRLSLKDSDQRVMTRLDQAAVSYQVVLTKCDKVSAQDLDGRIKALVGQLAKHPAAHPRIVPTSARTASGLDVLRGELAAFANG